MLLYELHNHITYYRIYYIIICHYYIIYYIIICHYSTEHAAPLGGARPRSSSIGPPGGTPNPVSKTPWPTHPRAPILRCFSNWGLWGHSYPPRLTDTTWLLSPQGLPVPVLSAWPASPQLSSKPQPCNPHLVSHTENLGVRVGRGPQCYLLLQALTSHPECAPERLPCFAIRAPSDDNVSYFPVGVTSLHPRGQICWASPQPLPFGEEQWYWRGDIQSPCLFPSACVN